MSGEVIEFTPQQARCKEEWGAAVVLIRHKNDTIRAILECFNDTLQAGTRVVIKPTREPDFDLTTPTDWEYYWEQVKNGLHIFRVNKYDDQVMKTVFGRIVSVN